MLAALLGLVSGLPCFHPPAAADEPPLPEPLPLRRVLVPADRAAAELERAKGGALTPLPRPVFEEKVVAAARTVEASKHPPRLIEARYRARLIDTALVGTAEWKIVNPTSVPAVLALQPFGLALRQARWPDNKDALLGYLDGSELGLLVEQPGPSSLSFDWSARSTPTVGGVRFSLDVPPCAVGSLELDLPANRAVAVSRETYLLTGPHDSPEPGRKVWRVGFTNRSLVNVVIRRTDGPGLPVPLVLGRATARQEITPGQLQADFDFDLEVLHGGVDELQFEFPTTVRPYEVNVPRNLQAWEVKAGAGNNPARLIVRFREPFHGGPVQVRCLAPLPSGTVWTSPGLRLQNGVVRDESLALRVHPDVQIEDWQPGGFRLKGTAFQNGWHVLNLVAGIESGPAPVRPVARIVTPGPEYKVRQLTWWQVSPERSTLTAQLTYEVSRGRLFRLPVQLPAAWEVEHVELSPPEQLGHVTYQADKAKTMMQVEMQGGLDAASNPARLTVRLRRAPTKMAPAPAATLLIPDVVPLGARLREGAVGISVAPAFQATVSASVPAGDPEVADREGEAEPAGAARPRAPWAKQALDYYFPFQAQPVEGTLQLRARPTQLRAVCTTDVMTGSGRAQARVRLELHPEVGALTAVDLFVWGPAAAEWEWHPLRGANSVARIERLRAAEDALPLAGLAARNPVGAVSYLAVAPPRGTWWRLTLARPLTEPLTLEARFGLLLRPAAERARLAPLAVFASPGPLHLIGQAALAQHAAAPAESERVWEVPLVTVPAADRIDGQVVLHLAGADLVQIEPQGLREVGDLAGREGTARTTMLSSTYPWKMFRYGRGPMGLLLRGGTLSADRFGEVVVDSASLATYLEAGDRLLHQFRFQLGNWRQQTLPVRLPAGAQLVALRIDGRWVDRLPPGKSQGAAIEFELPVPNGSTMHRFEMAYVTALPVWRVWSRLEAPAPELPVRPIAFRRTWCLPPGVVPLSEGSLQRLPGANMSWSWPWEHDRRPAGAEDWAARQSQLVGDAVRAVSRQHKLGAEWSLGHYLDRLALEHLKDRVPLVLDLEAFQALGLGPDTPLPSHTWERGDQAASGIEHVGPWNSVGLGYVPCRPAPLLTSLQQRAMWAGAPGPAIEAAVAEAAWYGQDRSGRFRRVVDWLASRGTVSTEARVLPDTLGPDWSEWEPLADGTHPEALTVIRPQAVPLVGLVLAAALGLAAIRLGRQAGRKRLRLFLGWLAVGGLGLLWLPAPLRPLAWGPAAVGVLVGLIWCIRLAQGPRPTARPAVPAATAALAALVGIGVLAGQAAAPGPVTVYLLPDPANSEKQIVLAPRDLLDQLDILARGPAASLHGAVVLAAAYEGRVEGPTATFEARFQVHCFASSDTVVLPLPLASVQLIEALLDGTPAHLVPLAAPREGYSLRVRGRGAHTVLLRFSVLLPAQSEDRELRFSVPEVPQARLVLDVPRPVAYLHAVEARGLQRVTMEEKRLRLDADLGAVNAVRVRWRQDASKEKSALLTVREGYYWELKSSSSRLLAVLQYTVQKGWDTTLQLELPKELEVVSVETGAAPGGPPAPRLREWLIKEDKASRRLELEFMTPLTQSVLVTLELVPRQPLGRQAILPFPTPVDAQPARGFLACKLDGLDATVAEHNAITGVKKEELTTSFADAFAGPWRGQRGEEIEPPTRAFWRTKGGILNLTLRAPAPATRAVQDVTWRVSNRQVGLRASVELIATDNNLGFVEWEVPAGLSVSEVSGQQVRHWTRVGGGRIQVWLHKPVGKAALQLTGWLSRPAKAPPRFDLPAVRVLDALPQTTSVRVLAGEGLTLAPGALQGLTGRPELTVAGRELAYTTDLVNYGGPFTISPAAANAYFHVLTFAEVRDRQLTFQTTIECTIHRGELRSLTIGLRNWEGEAQLDAGPGAKQRAHRLGAGGRGWTLELPPGVVRQYRLTVQGRLPLDGSSEVLLPDVRVEATDAGPAPQERWVGVAGPELEVKTAAGLEAAADPAAALRAWPREAERLRRAGGSAWKVDADDWRLRVWPRGPAGRADGIRVFLADHSAAVVDGRQWLHQSVYRLAHEGGADLTLKLRSGARVRGLAIDGVPVPPLVQPGQDRLWLPLPGGPGVHVVRVLWDFPPGAEPFDRPFLEAPRLEGAAEGPVFWTVTAPAGYRIEARSAPKESRADPADAAEAELARAEAQKQLAAWLVDHAGSSADPALGHQLGLAQERFERHCRYAEYLLNLPGQPVVDPDGARVSPASWLQGLRDHHAALQRTPDFQRLRAEAREPSGVLGSNPASSTLPRIALLARGRPTYWYGTAEAPLLQVQLAADDTTLTRQKLALSTLLLVLLFASWVLAYFFGAAAWPEQLALLGCLGLLLFGKGLGLVFLALPAAWAGARLWHLGCLLWLLLAKPQEPTSAVVAG